MWGQAGMTQISGDEESVAITSAVEARENEKGIDRSAEALRHPKSQAELSGCVREIPFGFAQARLSPRWRDAGSLG
jgi:hypothetical protein